MAKSVAVLVNVTRALGRRGRGGCAVGAADADGEGAARGRVPPHRHAQREHAAPQLLARDERPEDGVGARREGGEPAARCAQAPAGPGCTIRGVQSGVALGDGVQPLQARALKEKYYQGFGSIFGLRRLSWFSSRRLSRRWCRQLVRRLVIRRPPTFGSLYDEVETCHVRARLRGVVCMKQPCRPPDTGLRGQGGVGASCLSCRFDHEIRHDPGPDGFGRTL